MKSLLLSLKKLHGRTDVQLCSGRIKCDDNVTDIYITCLYIYKKKKEREEKKKEKGEKKSAPCSVDSAVLSLVFGCSSTTTVQNVYM